LRGQTQYSREYLLQIKRPSTSITTWLISGRGIQLLMMETAPMDWYALHQEKAKVFRIGAGGREQIIRMLRPQNFISYRSLFSENQYPFTVAAIEDSAIVVFGKHILSKILKQNADLAIKFIKVISE
jgi:signal-transduction protein with cAMP-binding, CBS, and nucleotidyltransferase domain